MNDIFALEKELSQAVENQEKKVFQLARKILPHLTAEDVRNPQDFPQLLNHKDFQFEDGIATGLRSALTILRRVIKENATE